MGGLAAGLASGLIAGALSGLATGISTGIAAAVGTWFAGVLLGRVTATPVRFEPAEQVRWSRPSLAICLRYSFIGCVTGLLNGLALAFIDTDLALVYAFCLGLAGVLTGAISSGLSSGLREERARPNEGIRRSAVHALIVGTLGGLLIGLVTASSISLGLGLHSLGTLSPGVIAVWGLTAGVAFGGAACIQHWVVRVELVREGVAPLRYVSFLEAMAERMILHRSGSGYLFVHRLLRDFLADGAKS